MISLNIPLKVDCDIQNVKLTVAESAMSYPFYKGETEVEPKTVSQILDTADKILLENVSVLKIPYFETSNLKGTTAIIGGNG